MGGQGLKYELVRSRRRSICITVKGTDICVRAPLNAPQSRIDAFIEEKRGWIEKKLAENAQKINVFEGEAAYRVFLFFGRELTPVFLPSVKKPDAGEGKLILPESYRLLPEQARLTRIRNWYKREAERYLKERLDELSAATGLTYSGFALTNAAGKWGSCGGDNFIRLNWRLIFLDSELSDYVVIHELCHTVEHNHSQKFWNAVRRFLPDCDKRKRALKSRSVLISLFRFSA